MIDENYKKLQKYIQDIDSFALSTATTSDDQLLFCAAMVSVVRNLYLENLGVEQTNLICSSDGKTWDQITRDISYIPKVSLNLRNGGNRGGNSVVLFEQFRGINGNVDYFHKDFSIAMDRFYCLREGTYSIHAQTISNASNSNGGHAQIRVNGVEVALGHTSSSSHSHVHSMAVVTLESAAIQSSTAKPLSTPICLQSCRKAIQEETESRQESLVNPPS